MNDKQRIAIVGAGNLGTALALALSKGGASVAEIAVRDRSGHKSNAAKLAKKIGAKLVLMGDELVSDVVWLAVTDGAIRDCAEHLARSGAWKGKIVLHSSGALASDELESLRKRGASVASAHPMMTFAGGTRPQFEGIAWTVEGDAKAVGLAKSLIRKLGGSSHRIDKKKKAQYHAFGAFLSPLLVVHLDAAAALAEAAGISREDIGRFMEPILRQTLQNMYAHIGEPGGMGKAFSGPLVRGDVNTIRIHIDALRKVPQAQKLYIALLDAALRSELPIKNREQLRALLSNAQ